MTVTDSTPRLNLQVVKVGGSLLDWPLLADALTRWLADQPRCHQILVCGGGPFADDLRRLCRTWSLSEEAAHWLCVDSLSVTARLLGEILPAAELIHDFEQLTERLSEPRPSTIIWDPRQFLSSREGSWAGKKLPHTWQATTDSIAARLAKILAADELTLLKSAAPPTANLVDLAAAGYVDGYFPIAAAEIAHVRLVNIRHFDSASSAARQASVARQASAERLPSGGFT